MRHGDAAVVSHVSGKARRLYSAPIMGVVLNYTTYYLSPRTRIFMSILVANQIPLRKVTTNEKDLHDKSNPNSCLNQAFHNDIKNEIQIMKSSCTLERKKQLNVLKTIDMRLIYARQPYGWSIYHIDKHIDSTFPMSAPLNMQMTNDNMWTCVLIVSTATQTRRRELAITKPAQVRIYGFVQCGFNTANFLPNNQYG